MIRILKFTSFLFSFYINSSTHVALAVYALLYAFVLTHKLAYDEALMYTVFFGTITSYNFVKYAPIAKLHHRSLTNSLRLIQIFSIICFVALLYYLVQLPLRTLGVFMVGLLLVITYVVPIIRQKNLRSVNYLKIYLVAICWGLIVVVTPSIHFKIDFSIVLFCQFVQVLILIIALIIPFDIRDMQHDNLALQTIPQKWGVFKAKSIAILLLLGYLVIDVFFLERHSLLWSSVVIVIITIGMILSMSKNPIKYYCSFGIESIPIFKLLLIYFMNRF